MSLHEAFLRSIIEAPDDDAPRLVYADWLEENGDPERAEFIRVQCRLASLDEDDPEHRGEWAGPLVGRVRCWHFRRGFVEWVEMKAGEFLEEANWLLDFAPIRELAVEFPKIGVLR